MENHSGHGNGHGNGHSDGHETSDHNGGDHHAQMVADFRRRFWISLVLTIPILALLPLVQGFLGLEEVISFPGDTIVLFVFSTAVFFYGGWPFLSGLYDELSSAQPGMMTLIGVAITVASLCANDSETTLPSSLKCNVVQ